MVRTRADNCGRKAVASKAPRKNFNAGGSSSSFSSSGGDGVSGGGCNLTNHAKMWPTPKWQKGIGTFFQKKEKTSNPDESSESSGSSSPKEHNKDIKTEEVVVLDTRHDSDKENDTTNSVAEEKDVEKKDVEEKELDQKEKNSTSKTGKQKSSVLGKVVGGSSSKKKRRVVLADDSDED